MKVSLTVGKVDAGVAVLLTDDKRLIEFPSILLPADIHSGSIVDVNVLRNQDAEATAAKSFHALQSEILSTFGSESPQTPVLRCRNATQTSLVLEWDPIQLATAELRSLTLFRNGNKAGNIPRPFETTSTKISGLALDTQYSFSLVLRTSAGTYTSEKLAVRTHKMTDLTGITVTPGFMAPALRESLQSTIEQMGAKLIEQVQIDTTHFVCTEGRGSAWEKANTMNVPVVQPDWVKGCAREGRIVGVRGYYLGADPKTRQVGPGVGLQRENSQLSTQQSPSRTLDAPRTPQVTPPTPDIGLRNGGQDDDEEDEDEAEHGQQQQQQQQQNGARGEGSSKPAPEDDDEEDDDEDDEGEQSYHQVETSLPDRSRSHEEAEAIAQRVLSQPAKEAEDADEDTGEGFDDVKL